MSRYRTVQLLPPPTLTHLTHDPYESKTETSLVFLSARQFPQGLQSLKMKLQTTYYIFQLLKLPLFLLHNGTVVATQWENKKLEGLI